MVPAAVVAAWLICWAATRLLGPLSRAVWWNSVETYRRQRR